MTGRKSTSSSKDVDFFLLKKSDNPVFVNPLRAVPEGGKTHNFCSRAAEILKMTLKRYRPDGTV